MNWWEIEPAGPRDTVLRVRAVAYYRHSAQDRQENSKSIQRDQVRAWAEKHGVDIIHEFADAGKSGLNPPPCGERPSQSGTFSRGRPDGDSGSSRGGVPALRDLRWRRSTPSTVGVEPLVAAGLAPVELLATRGTRWSKERILEVIHARQREGKPINYSAIRRENSAHISAARRYFGNWSKTLLAAGVDVERRTSLPRSHRSEFLSRNFNPGVANFRGPGVLFCAARETGRFLPETRSVSEGYPHSRTRWFLSPNVARDHSYSHGGPSDAAILAQTLGRLSVSRCLGYRGVGFALSVATYRGWLRGVETGENEMAPSCYQAFRHTK